MTESLYSRENYLRVQSLDQAATLSQAAAYVKTKAQVTLLAQQSWQNDTNYVSYASTSTAAPAQHFYTMTDPKETEEVYTKPKVYTENAFKSVLAGDSKSIAVLFEQQSDCPKISNVSFIVDTKTSKLYLKIDNDQGKTATYKSFRLLDEETNKPTKDITSMMRAAHAIARTHTTDDKVNAYALAIFHVSYNQEQTTVAMYGFNDGGVNEGVLVVEELEVRSDESPQGQNRTSSLTTTLWRKRRPFPNKPRVQHKLPNPKHKRPPSSYMHQSATAKRTPFRGKKEKSPLPNRSRALATGQQPAPKIRLDDNWDNNFKNMMLMDRDKVDALMQAEKENKALLQTLEAKEREIERLKIANMKKPEGEALELDLDVLADLHIDESAEIKALRATIAQQEQELAALRKKIQTASRDLAPLETALEKKKLEHEAIQAENALLKEMLKSRSEALREIEQEIESQPSDQPMSPAAAQTEALPSLQSIEDNLRRIGENLYALPLWEGWADHSDSNLENGE